MNAPFRKLTITYQTENKTWLVSGAWSCLQSYTLSTLSTWHINWGVNWSTEEITFKLQIIDLIIVFGRKMYTPENIMQVLVSEANTYDAEPCSAKIGC
jgi:hypothetical protein